MLEDCGGAEILSQTAHSRVAHGSESPTSRPHLASDPEENRCAEVVLAFDFFGEGRELFHGFRLRKEGAGHGVVPSCCGRVCAKNCVDREKVFLGIVVGY